MDTRTGLIEDYERITQMPPEQRGHFVEVKRDLTELEKLTKQIKLYSPCGCGSGKKFKFCCFKPA